MEKPLIPAVSLALRRGPRLLLVRRGREPSRGLYAFPGGKVEPGEGIENAARRELAEETGLHVGEVRLLQVLDLEAPQAVYRLHVFGAEHVEGEPIAGDDAEAAGWFVLDEIASLPLTESTRAIALELLRPVGGDIPSAR